MSHLPACMAMEMVSPAVKFNQPARIYQPSLEAGVRAPYTGGIAVPDDRILFSALTSLDGSSDFLRVSGDPYVASRDAASESWVATGTSAGRDRFWGLAQTPRARAFGADYSRWFNIAATESQYRRGDLQVVKGTLGANSEDVTSVLSPAGPLGTSPQAVLRDARDKGASGDGSQFYFAPGSDPSLGAAPTYYLSGDPKPAGVGAKQNTYVASTTTAVPGIELLARDMFGKVWGGNCGASIAGSDSLGTRGASRGAVSYTGDRVYISTRPEQAFDSSLGDGPPCDGVTNKARILLREEGPLGPRIEPLFESECGRIAEPGPPEVLACNRTMTGPFPPAGGNVVPDGDDAYQGGSSDGLRVYFTTSRQLASSDVNGLDDFGVSGCAGSFGMGVGGCDLYLYDSHKPLGQRLTQVTVNSSGVNAPSVVQVSGDGSHVYFQSAEALTASPGPKGDTAQDGQPNLYLYDAETDQISFIGATTATSSWPIPVYGIGDFAGEAQGNGSSLVFVSAAPLTADDLDGGHADVFRYSAATHQILRISKANPGSLDNGPHDVATADGMGTGEASGGNDPAEPDIGVRGRWASDDGRTIAFKTSERLAAEDNNGVLDSYLWHDGELIVIPGTADHSGDLEDRPLVAVSGKLVAFQSAEQLLPGDGDSAVDVYAMRSDGGFKAPPELKACVPDAGEACQGRVGAPLAGPKPLSEALNGGGNLKEPADRDCGRLARRLINLREDVKRLRSRAARSSNPLAKRGLNRRAGRVAKKVRRSAAATKKCRRANSGGEG